MRRLLPLCLAFVVACSGGPAGVALPPSAQSSLTAEQASRHRTHVPVKMQIRIPRRRHHRNGSDNRLHSNTISPLTLSVSVADNSNKTQVFNTTPSSTNCSTTSGALICAFQIFVDGGNNTLVVKTFSAVNAGGYVLDQATLVTSVTKTTTSIGIVLGPVISNNNDSGAGSLRQALADANAGDTLMYVGTTPATITLSSGAVALPKNLTIAGPGANKLTIDANNASQAFTIGAGINATISGVTITKGTSVTNGGAIKNAGTLALTNDTISNSSATVAGGAVENTGTLTSNSNSYSGNASLSGGAIDNTGTLTVTSDSFNANNTAGSGVGPTFVNSTRPARMPKRPHFKRLHVRGRVRHAPAMPKQVFPPDHMRPHPAATSVPNGGAIYNGTAGTINVTNASFTGNGAQQGDGGAISSASGAAGWTITNDTFTSNTAAYGGAVAVDTAGTLDSDTFTTNSGYPGNGLSIAPYGYGGAVYASAALTVTNCTFTGNIAGGGSQALAFGYGGAIEADNAALTVSGSTFSNNVAGGASSSGSSGQGGAIDTTSTSSLAVSVTNSTFTGNTAGGGSTGTSYGYGGAIDTETYNTLVINGSTFTSNAAGGDGYGNGGAIYIQADLTGSNDAFSKNAATGTSVTQSITGGAIDSNSTIELSGSSFSQNSATGGNGVIVNGGAIAAASTLTIDSSTFTSNSASAPGGSSLCGAGVQGTGGMTITNSTFTSNSLTTGAGGFTDGSGLCNFNAAVTISGTTFTSNTGTGGSGSTEDGGGAELDSPSTLTNVTFSQNTLSGTGTGTFVQGGGLYLINGTTISNGTFTQNSATTAVGTGNEGWGGAINSGALTFSGSVTGNIASAQGAGIYSGGLSMTNSTVSGNSVTAAVAVAQPTPDGGGGVYLVGAHTNTIATSTISGNSVAGSGTGGGILNTSNSSPGTLTLTNDTIANNTSAVDGGGLEDLGSTSSLLNATMYGNTATSGNGGNWNNANTPTSPDSTGSSIFGGGTAGGTGPDINNGGTINSGDYNVIQTVLGGSGFASPPPHDQTANPLLSALASNGGPTQTMADSNTSPGYNKIPVSAASCNGSGVTTDQRGNARPGAGHANCDAGAYEFP